MGESGQLFMDGSKRGNTKQTAEGCCIDCARKKHCGLKKKCELGRDCKGNEATVERHGFRAESVKIYTLRTD